MKWEWMNEWWRVFGDDLGRAPGGLRIFTLSFENVLVGILPLYLKSSSVFASPRLGFISTGEGGNESAYPEYLDVLVDADHRNMVISALRRPLFLDTMVQWENFSLGLTSENSTILEVLNDFYPPADGLVESREHRAPIADISGGFSTYLSRLNSSHRRDYRRLVKKFDGDERFKFEVAKTGAEADSFMDELIRLHQSRWRKRGALGAFATRRAEEFHKSVARKLVPKGEAVVARLSYQGEHIALAYGFISGKKFDFYQSGIGPDDHLPIKSPGILLQLLIIRHLSEIGIQTYDFLAGLADYKRRLATGENRLLETSVVCPKTRSARLRILGERRLKLVGRQMRSLIQRITG